MAKRFDTRGTSKTFPVLFRNIAGLKSLSGLFALGFGLACGDGSTPADAGNQSSPDQSAPQARQETDPLELPERVQGNYVEVWGGAPADQSRHQLEATMWIRDEGGSYPARYPIALLQSTKNTDTHWSAIFVYPNHLWHFGHFLRVDLSLDDEGVLYFCDVQVDARDFDEAQAAPLANPSDRLGKGCHGFPWRKLDRVAAESAMLPESR